VLGSGNRERVSVLSCAGPGRVLYDRIAVFLSIAYGPGRFNGRSVALAMLDLTVPSDNHVNGTDPSHRGRLCALADEGLKAVDANSIYLYISFYIFLLLCGEESGACCAPVFGDGLTNVASGRGGQAVRSTWQENDVKTGPVISVCFSAFLYFSAFVSCYDYFVLWVAVTM